MRWGKIKIIKCQITLASKQPHEKEKVTRKTFQKIIACDDTDCKDLTSAIVAL